MAAAVAYIKIMQEILIFCLLLHDGYHAEHSIKRCSELMGNGRKKPIFLGTSSSFETDDGVFLGDIVEDDCNSFWVVVPVDREDFCLEEMECFGVSFEVKIAGCLWECLAVLRDESFEEGKEGFLAPRRAEA